MEIRKKIANVWLMESLIPIFYMLTVGFSWYGKILLVGVMALLFGIFSIVFFVVKVKYSMELLKEGKLK